jgi:hypothetical protein
MHLHVIVPVGIQWNNMRDNMHLVCAANSVPAISIEVSLV